MRPEPVFTIFLCFPITHSPCVVIPGSSATVESVHAPGDDLPTLVARVSFMTCDQHENQVMVKDFPFAFRIQGMVVQRRCAESQDHTQQGHTAVIYQ